MSPVDGTLLDAWSSHTRFVLVTTSRHRTCG
jgi:hypothetical protein